jgi:hypothetical protein
MLVKVGATTQRTNLIVHHGIADILNHSAKPIHILGAVQEPCDLASLRQWGEVSENAIQFPSR